MSSDNLESLRRGLLDLNGAIEVRRQDINTKALAEDVLEAIGSLDKPDFALASAYIFDSENGLLTYLRSSRGRKEHEDAQAVLLNALERFMSASPASCRPYTAEIQTDCINAFDSAKAARTKDASLMPLNALIVPTIGAGDAEKLQVKRIISFFFDVYVRQQSKLGALVKGSILKLLAAACRHHWNVVEGNLPKQMDRMLQQAISTLFGKDPNLSYVESALRALDEFMFVYTDVDLTAVFTIIKNILGLLSSADTFSRYGVFTATMQIIIDHATSFKSLLYNRAMDVWNDLRAACTNRNSDVSRLGYRAMDSFLGAVALVLREDEGDEAKRLFWWFMTRFGELIGQELTYKDTSLAVRAYGYFAAPCRRHGTAEDLRGILDTLMKKSAALLTANPTQNRDESVHVPSFLEAYSYMAEQHAEADKKFYLAIADLSKSMLLRYPSMSSAYQGLSVAALRKLLLILNRQGPGGRNVWSTTAYDALLLTCSTPNSDTNMESTRFAFDDYMNFWIHLFRSPSAESHIDPAEKQNLNRMLYDETVTAMLQMAENLNLNIIEPESEPTDASELAVVVTYANPADIAILSNLTRFADRFLTDVQSRNFAAWLYVVGDRLIELSLRNPMITSIYNLLSVVLKLAASLDFFKDVLKPETLGAREGMDEETLPTANSSQKSAHLLFSSYIKTVAVRSEGFKDDLLASSLRLLLSCPTDLVSVRALTEPLRTAFRLGLSYQPLAEAAITALERWVNDIPTAVLRTAYPKILPALADYLLLDVEQTARLEKKKVKMNRGIFHMKGVAASRMRIAAIMSETEDASAQSCAIRLRVITLLGNIGTSNRLMLAGFRENQQILAWDTEKRLAFDVPFAEMSCRIYLDDMLPRVIELAENSPDRKTKVAATELLHALVLLMIGRSAKQLSGTGETEVKQSPFHKLYSKVFPALLRLAIDLDTVTRELFRPLVFQIIHWLTRNARAENPETMAMLNVCLEAVSGTNGALRDFAGECIREFLIWSIKHTPPASRGQDLDEDQDHETKTVNTKSLLRRLFRLLSHSSSQKRLGAAIAFNRIYRVLREDDALMSEFLFLTLYNLLGALRLADQDPPASGVHREIKNAIGHCVKILKAKKDVFNRVYKKRREFPGLRRQDLDGLLDWIFLEIGKPELDYAQMMKGLFMEIVPLVSSPKSWVGKRIKADSNYVPNILNNNLQNVPRGLRLSERRAKKWVGRLISSLEGYTFLLDTRILDGTSILSNNRVLLSAITFFVENYALRSEEPDLDPQARLQADELRSFATVRVFGILEALLQSGTEIPDSVGLWTPHFFRLVALVIFKPAAAGFAPESEDVKRNLPLRMVSLLRLIPTSTLRFDCIRDVYLADDCDISSLDLTDGRNRLAISQSVIGLQQIQKAGLFAKFMESTDVDVYNQLFDATRQMRKNTSPGTTIIVGNMVEICLESETHRERCFRELLGLESRSKYENGIAFYQQYGNHINPWIARNLGASIPTLEKYLHHPLVSDILRWVSNYLLVNRSAKDTCHKIFIDQLVGNDGFVRKMSEVFDPSDLLQLWHMIVRLDPGIVARTQGTRFCRIFTQVYVSFLNSSNPRPFLNDAFALLSVFLTPENAEEVENRLSKIVNDHFPLSPGDMKEGSSQQVDYAQSMATLLDGLGTLNTIVIAKVLIMHICIHPNHPFAEQLGERLANAGRRCPPKDVGNLLALLWSYFGDATIPADFRKNVVRYALLPLLRASSPDFVAKTFEQEINNIMTILKQTLSPKPLDLLMSKTAGFELLTTCYQHSDVSALHSAEGIVMRAFIKKFPDTPNADKPNALSVAIIRQAEDAQKERIPDIPNARQLGLEFHQAAFNACCAVFAATQTKNLEFFLVKKIFQRDAPHWSNIVDMEENVEDVLQFEIQNDANAAEQSTGRYVSTQFLAESSLSQTTSLSIPDGAFTQEAQENGLENRALNHAARADRARYIYGHNPCTGTVVELISKVSGTVQDGASMPGWMTELLERMQMKGTPLNLRVYIAAIVLNRKELFSAYAEQWWRPVAEVIQDYPYSNGIGPMIQSLCNELLLWGGHLRHGKTTTAHFSPPDKSQSRAVIYGMMRALVGGAIRPKSMAEVKRNMSIISAFVEMWKHLMTPTTEEILNCISDGEKKINEKDKKELLAGILLTSVFILNDINPFDVGGLGNRSMSEMQFWKIFLSLLDHKRRDVYASAAEVFGRWLALVQKQNLDLYELLQTELQQRISSLNGIKGTAVDQDRFIQTLASLSTGYPEIVKGSSRDLLYIFPRLSGKLRARCLYAISSCGPQIENIFEDLRAKNLKDLIAQRDEETQRLILVILYNLVPSLTVDQISYFLPTMLRTFNSSSSELCRTAYFSLLVRIYDRLEDNDNLRNKVRLAILEGLVDPLEEIRSGVGTFLNQDGQLGNKDIYQRTQLLLGMYDPQIESSFLHFVTSFLLDATKETPQYTAKLFDSGLPDAKFVDAHIDVSWTPAGSMQPIFAATQNGNASLATGTPASQFVRATQQAQWTLTQDMNPTQARDAFSVVESEVSLALGSLQDTSSGASLGGRSRRTEVDVRRHYANQSERQRRIKLQTQMLQKAARAKTVTLSRKYRIGELPDIEIGHKEVLAPLQHLVTRDAEVAQHAFSALLTAIVDNVGVGHGKRQRESDSFRTAIEEGLSRIISTSTNFHPPMLAAALRSMYSMSSTNFDPVALSRASEQSSNTQLGVSLLEQALLAGKAPATKRRRTDDDVGPGINKQLWLRLAFLYKSIAYFNVYRSIVEHRISTSPFVKEAIAAETMKQYDNALQKYKESLSGERQDRVDQYERDICHRGHGECLENLGLWEALAEHVMEHVDNQTQNLWKSENVDPYLEQFFKAYLRLRDGIVDESGIFIPWEGTSPLMSLVNVGLNDATKKELLENKFPEELCLLMLSSGDLQRARHYSQRAIDGILASFTSLHPLASEARQMRLSSLQIIVEVKAFVDLLESRGNTDFGVKVGKFLASWDSRSLSPLQDPMPLWLDVVLSREQILEQFGRLDLMDVDQAALQPVLTKLHKGIRKAATKQHNFVVAERYTTASEDFDPEVSLATLKLAYKRLIYLDDVAKAELASRTVASFSYYSARIASLDTTLRAKYMFLQGRLFDEIFKGLIASEDFSSTLQGNKYMRKALKSAGGGRSPNASGLLAFAIEESLKYLTEGVTLAPSNKRRMYLATHCDSMVRLKEDSPDSPCDFDLARYAVIATEHTLAAMQDVYAPAIEIFPRLLQLLHTYDGVGNTFLQLATNAPAWTFLRWLPQITALLDKPAATALFPLMHKIAAEYPTAVYFPLSISSEQYVLDDPNRSNNGKEVAALKEVIHSPLLDKLKMELRRLTEPVHTFKDWIQETQPLLMTNPKDSKAILELFEDMKAYCLNTDPHVAGSIGMAFATKYSAKIFQFCGKDGRKLLTLSSKDWREFNDYCRNNIFKESLPTGMMPLKNYSPWLAAFNAKDFEEDLEIPGQYTESKKPIPENLVTISSFQSEVLVMASIRRPKRLTIVGSDEKNQHWLIKGGEDLRLDQRVQEMFSVMNNIMANDSGCQDLQLRTYKVVPMSRNLGILEWVDNTKPLLEVMRSVPGFKEAFANALKKHDEFVQAHGGNKKSLPEQHCNMFKTASARKTEEHLDSVTPREPYLKRWMQKLAASPEAFLTIRGTFARSLATLNICSYLLGIGDRHGENFLIDMSSGQIIGIDFGHAFGSATEVLPIPELVPFRLTKQMALVLEPLGVPVLLQDTMINVMSAMRSKKEVLLNVLNIFIKEPLMEWRTFALKQAARQGKGTSLSTTPAEGSSSLNAPEWYPQQKLDIARRKLNGEHPSHLTALELQYGHSKEPWFSAARDIVLGKDATHGKRYAVGPVCKDVREQVECTVEQAMDANVLGRAYRGWAAWA
ncbi:uncharacterized protein EV422DRAFT_578857 [Fimicolochytrium jonesii]|uniref:uncharacterized protein n=1 Tax=Fimicolochytrium jonesii TaxID=1396493 RepID=UPI0022FF1CC1|nr:uncharacterized protein EV422DRAFT_578857 [Fimicolochytrium jonesii]KAI8820570.1 hypothetical protein EV422DRAFT_578857 [Fimicolochytrium jonesii]